MSSDPLLQPVNPCCSLCQLIHSAPYARPPAEARGDPVAPCAAVRGSAPGCCNLSPLLTPGPGISAQGTRVRKREKNGLSYASLLKLKGFIAPGLLAGGREQPPHHPHPVPSPRHILTRADSAAHRPHGESHRETLRAKNNPWLFWSCRVIFKLLALPARDPTPTKRAP